MNGVNFSGFDLCAGAFDGRLKIADFVFLGMGIDAEFFAGLDNDNTGHDFSERGYFRSSLNVERCVNLSGIVPLFY